MDFVGDVASVTAKSLVLTSCFVSCSFFCTLVGEEIGVPYWEAIGHVSSRRHWDFHWDSNRQILPCNNSWSVSFGIQNQVQNPIWWWSSKYCELMWQLSYVLQEILIYASREEAETTKAFSALSRVYISIPTDKIVGYHPDEIDASRWGIWATNLMNLNNIHSISKCNFVTLLIETRAPLNVPFKTCICAIELLHSF